MGVPDVDTPPPSRLPRSAGGDARLRLLDLPPAEQRGALELALKELGAPAYRARQVLHDVWQRHVRRFGDMSALPGPLRAALDERVRIGLLETAERAASADGTVKYLWRLADGEEVESVAIPTDKRLTFCVSSQVGCSVSCRFCATGYLGFRRNLTPGEILDQVLAMLADLGRDRALNVVFMGMGEPGYNVESVLAACRALNDPAALGIGARHLTVSTSGVVPAIHRLAEEPLQVRLAVSLHSADQRKRCELMDMAERFPLTELLAACQQYERVTGRHVTFEYTVLPGVNDGDEDARLLGEFASAVPSKVNLIPYNPVAEFPVGASTELDARVFAERLRAHFAGEVAVRRTRGRDIEAACGMLHRARRGAGTTA